MPKTSLLRGAIAALFTRGFMQTPSKSRKQKKQAKNHANADLPARAAKLVNVPLKQSKQWPSKGKRSRRRRVGRFSFTGLSRHPNDRRETHAEAEAIIAAGGRAWSDARASSAG